MKPLRYNGLVFFLLILTALTFFFLGRYGCSAPVAETGQALLLQAEKDPDGSTQLFHPAELTTDELTQNMYYVGLSRVTVTVDGHAMALEDALHQGMITFAQLAADAQLDARNGFCEESATSYNGVSYFVYRYPELSVGLVNDVYATPDGQQHLIRKLSVYAPDEDVTPPNHYYDSNWGLLDLEDWGLTFSVEQVSTTAITLRCTQSGGQQIGQLSVDWYSLRNEQGFLPNLSGTAESPSCEVALQMDGETQITLDWTEEYGSLPGGQYVLTLNIQDHYDPSQLHPLMQNFHDWQAYNLEFTIS